MSSHSPPQRNTAKFIFNFVLLLLNPYSDFYLYHELSDSSTPKQLSELNRLLTIYITVATKKGETHTLAWVLMEQTDLVTKQAFGKLPVAMPVAMSALDSRLYI